MALHPDVVCFFLFFLSAGIAEGKDVSSQSWTAQDDAILKHESPYNVFSDKPEMIFIHAYRRSGWSRQRDVGQVVCFREARDPETGACVMIRS
jgi:hypothetical protein